VPRSGELKIFFVFHAAKNASRNKFIFLIASIFMMCLKWKAVELEKFQLIAKFGKCIIIKIMILFLVIILLERKNH